MIQRLRIRLLTALVVGAVALGALPSLAADPAPPKSAVEPGNEVFGTKWVTLGIAGDRKEEDHDNLTGGFIGLGEWDDESWKHMTFTGLCFLEYRNGGSQQYGGFGANVSLLLRGGPFRVGPRLGLRLLRYRLNDPHRGWGLSAGPGLEAGFLIKQRFYFGVFWEREFDTAVPAGNLYGISLQWNIAEGGL
jgi:hypothetical protein